MERYQQQYRALGSEVLLTVVTEAGAGAAQELLERLHQHIAAFEQQFSRFLPASELSRFNARSGKKTAVSPALRRLLAAARDMGQQTGGLYNPFILPALQQAGYVGSWPQTDTDTASLNFTARKVVPVDQLSIGSTWAKIPPDAALDFGGIGKGYLLDELAGLLRSETVGGYWLSLGGDIICDGYDLGGHPWQVAVQHATEGDQHVGTIVNTDGQRLAIATSGITKRQGVKNGRPWHHLIDPRTGQPAETPVLTATVTAAQAVVADVYAKCVVIAGPGHAQLYKQAGTITSFWVQMSVPGSTIRVLEG